MSTIHIQDDNDYKKFYFTAIMGVLLKKQLFTVDVILDNRKINTQHAHITTRYPIKYTTSLVNLSTD